MVQNDPKGWRYPDGQYERSSWICGMGLLADECQAQDHPNCGWIDPARATKLFDQMSAYLADSRSAFSDAAQATEMTSGVLHSLWQQMKGDNDQTT